MFPTKLNESTIGNVHFQHLDTRAKLVEEGHQKLHCVGTYAHACYTGSSRIFTITEGNHPTGTLELRFDTLKGNWRVNQCLGVRNTRLNPTILKAAAAFARQYTRANPQAHDSLPELPHFQPTRTGRHDRVF